MACLPIFRRIRISLIFLGLCLALVSDYGTLWSQIGGAGGNTGKHGTPYSYGAWPIKPGRLYVFQSTRYFNGGERFDFNTARLESGFNNFNTSLGINWSFSENFDFVFSGRFMQFTNLPSSAKIDDITLYENNIADAFYVNFRVVPFKFMQEKIRLGFLVSGQFNSGTYPNVPFETYSAGGVEGGLTLLGSYYSNNLLPDDGWSTHLNVGYWIHNDAGKKIAPLSAEDIYTFKNVPFGSLDLQALRNTEFNEFTVTDGNTAELRFSTGFRFPFRQISSGALGNLSATADLYGLLFMETPPSGAYSSQDFVFGAAGLRYQILDWLGFNLGGEFLVWTKEDVTFYDPVFGVERLTVASGDLAVDYPLWRAFGGFDFDLFGTRIKLKKITKRQVAKQKEKEIEDLIFSEQEMKKRSSKPEQLKETRSDYSKVVEELHKVLKEKDVPKDEYVVDEDEE